MKPHQSPTPLFKQYKVSKDDGRHCLQNDRGTKREADIVTAGHLESIHLSRLEVEGCLGLTYA